MHPLTHLLRGITIGKEGLRISQSQLQFEHDTILLCEADLQEVAYIKRVSSCFEILGGLRINYSSEWSWGGGKFVGEQCSRERPI